MALSVDKDGKIIEKHLLIDESTIKEIVSKADRSKHKKVLERALKTKITRRAAS